MARIEQLAADYIDFAAQEQTRSDGSKRGKESLYSYRRAVEGFVQAANQLSVPLNQLPENFLHTHWFKTQEHVKSLIQLRSRAVAARRFAEWIAQQGVAITPLAALEVTTTARHAAKNVKEKETSMTPQNVVYTGLAEGLDSLTEPGAEPLAVAPPPPPFPPAPPATVSAPPAPNYVAPAPSYIVPPPPPQEARSIMPPQAPAGRRAPLKQNQGPLASMFPSSDYKLRVRFDREGEDMVFVKDFHAERVMMFGALEPFLQKEAMPVVAPQMREGEPVVNFIVSQVSPDGREGQRMKIPLLVPVGARPTNAAPGQQQAFTAEQFMEYMAVDRNARGQILLQLKEMVDKEQGAQPQMQPNFGRAPVEPPPAPPNNEDKRDKAIELLAGGLSAMQDVVSRLMERVTEMGATRAEPPPVVQPPNQMDILDKIIAVLKPQTAAPALPQPSLTELLTILEKTRTMFQPHQMTVDTSELQDELAEMRQRLEKATKRDAIGDWVEQAKGLQAALGVFNPGGQQLKSPSFGETVIGVVREVLSRSDEIASMVERMTSSAAKAKIQTMTVAAARMRPTQPAVPQSDAAVSQLAQPTPTAPPVDEGLHRVGGASITKDVRGAIEALYKVQGDAGIFQAAVEMVMAFGRVEETKKVPEHIQGYIDRGEAQKLEIYLFQLLKAYGYEAYFTAEKVHEIVGAVQRHAAALQAGQAATAEVVDDAETVDEVDEVAEVEELKPTLAVKLGRKAPPVPPIEEAEIEGEGEGEEGESESEGESEGEEGEAEIEGEIEAEGEESEVGEGEGEEVAPLKQHDSKRRVATSAR